MCSTLLTVNRFIINIILNDPLELYYIVFNDVPSTYSNNVAEYCTANVGAAQIKDINSLETYFFLDCYLQPFRF